MRKVAKFFRLPGLERRLFIEAVFWCAVARLVILFLPFRVYSRLLGRAQGEAAGTGEFIDRTGSAAPPLGDENGKTRNECLQQIARAVRRASRHVPWETRCLVKAIAAKRMLSRRKINCTIYLGVAKDNDRLIAHAWLTSGDIIITGKNSGKHYSVVSIFE
jgi:hypothetical protein